MESTSRPGVRGVLALLALVLVAGCSGTADTSGEPETPRPKQPVGSPADPPPVDTATATAPVTPTVNGRITGIQRHLRSDAGSYDWLAFDSASDTGLFVSYVFCRDCRPSKIEVARLSVVGRTGKVAALACSDGPICHARDDGIAATLGPGSDEVTVESGDRTLNVIGYDGRLRRTLDLTATLASGDDIAWLAWSPDGSRLAVLTDTPPHGSDVWLVEGDDPPRLAYSAKYPWTLRPAWSPDGQSLLFEQVTRGQAWPSVSLDVVVLHRSSTGSSPAMTARTLYRSNRHFDWAGNLAWSPDGTRIAVRADDSIVEISAEDGAVLARHPQDRGNAGWLIWLERDQ